MGRPRGTGFLSEEAIAAAYREHQKQGTTLLALAEKNWSAWGYKNSNAAVGAISGHFRRRGLSARTHKEAVALGFARPGGAKETTGNGGGRNPNRTIKTVLSDRARAEFKRRAAEELAAACAIPECAALIAEQERDARWGDRMPQSFASLDALICGDGNEWYEVVRLPSMQSAEEEVFTAAARATLLAIVGDMGPENVQRMTAWDLDRLRARLVDADLVVPAGVQDAERDRLRDPNRHTGGSVPKMGKRCGGRRTRKQQQQVTRDHNVRDLPTRAKREHAQMRRVRRDGWETDRD